MTFWTEMLGGRIEYVQGDQYRTRCLHTGSGDEPPLILIHGIGGHAETYIKNMVGLADRLGDRSIYAVDLIGHGYSDAPTDIDYTISDYQDHIEDLIHALGYESAHVSGESLGGWIACRFGIDRPELVESIGLNTMAGLGASVQDHVSEAIREKQDEETQDLYDRTMSMLEESFPRDGVRRRCDWLFVDEPPEEIVDVRHQIYQREEVQEVMPQIYHLVLADATEDPFISTDELSSIDVPTLLIHSTYNPGAKTDMIEYVVDLIPNNEYELFENSAHWPQYEEAEKFNRVTAAFINNL